MFWFERRAHFIEWTAQQPWCNGKVAMAGSSALAISQWHIAAQQPPHLACIAPWEGMSDMYRESIYEGGIPSIQFTRFATLGAAGLNGIDDQAAMSLKYPPMNVYWRRAPSGKGIPAGPHAVPQAASGRCHDDGL